MDYRKYQKIRAHCWQDLAAYIDTPSNNSTLKFNLDFSKIPALTEIDHERKMADGLFQCSDLTPRENAAAHALAVISNHRAIIWWREPETPDGKPSIKPLEPWQLANLEGQTKQAIFEYAAYLPEREAAALLGLVQTIAQTEPQAAPVEGAPASETPEQRRARWLAMLEVEEKREKRGALQRVADREGVDRSNMRKDIEKARAIRTEQNQAGFFVSQLVQNGKRKG